MLKTRPGKPVALNEFSKTTQARKKKIDFPKKKVFLRAETLRAFLFKNPEERK